MDNQELVRSADFEERVQKGGPFKSWEFELMSQEEFDLVLPALGPAQAHEAEMIRKMSADKKKGTGPAREIN